jgi:hypothetical protein
MLIREAFLDDLNAVGHMEMHFANEGMYALRQASTLRLITELSHSLYKGH